MQITKPLWPRALLVIAIAAIVTWSSDADCASLSTAGKDVRATSDGKAIFVLRGPGDVAEMLVDSARVKAEFDRAIRAIALAPDGRQLAVAHKKNVTIIGVDSAETISEFKFPRDVYWIGWLANDSDLIAVCGKEAPRAAFVEGSTGAMGESFTIQLMRAATTKAERLYACQDYPPGTVTPSLSDDRMSLTFYSRDGMEVGVKMILSLTELKVRRYDEFERDSTAVAQ